jgi:hypothetical protein
MQRYLSRLRGLKWDHLANQELVCLHLILKLAVHANTISPTVYRVIMPLRPNDVYDS